MVIFFSDEDYPIDAVEPHEDALVITTEVSSVNICMIMINNGSLAFVLYSHAYQRIDFCQESPSYGFSNDLVHDMGTIELSLIFSTTPP